ncbi:MAG: calcium/sodium antiporter [bacterium]
MMDLINWGMGWIIAFFSIGLILLFGSGHALVQGSSRLARSLGIHPIIVGLTIVALGTSMPEFVVSLIAAIKGKTNVALGNIVGSNVTNIGLILGLSALTRPIAIHLKLLKFEVPLVVGISFYFWAICSNGALSRIDGFTLSVGFLAYLAIVISGAKKGSVTIEEKYKTLNKKEKRMGLNILLIMVGIAGLTISAEWVVNSVSEISRRLGASELVLGLTIVALGTSLPELATSIVAALKKEGDISAGNIVGSNIFNIMAIAGPSALANPIPVTKDIVYNHLPIMSVLTLILFPLFKTGSKLGRKEGGFLLLCYLGIMAWWTL